MRIKLQDMVAVSAKFIPSLGMRAHMQIVQQNFVKVMRAVELILGIPVPGVQFSTNVSTSNFTEAITSVVNSTGLSDIFTDEVKSVLQDAVPILGRVGSELAIPTIFDFDLASAPLHSQRTPLVSK